MVSGVAIFDFTYTLNDVEPWFPAASDAVHVTDVFPIGKKLPDGGVQVGPDVTPTSSVTIGIAYVTLEPFDVKASIVISETPWNVGGLTSPGPSLIIVTVNVSVAVFPAASDAVHVTIVFPTGNTVPDCGVHVGPDVTP